MTLHSRAKRTRGSLRWSQSTDTGHSEILPGHRAQRGTRALGRQWHGDYPQAQLTNPHPQAWQHRGDVGQVVRPPPPLRGQGRGPAAQEWGSSTFPMPRSWPVGGDTPCHPGLVGDPGPRARLGLVLLGRGEPPGKGLLWEHPAATGCHVPSQPSCEAPGGGFRDWRSSSEHQFHDRGGLSGGTNSCKRNQRERELLTGKRWAPGHGLQARRAKNQNKKGTKAKSGLGQRKMGGGKTKIK